MANHSRRTFLETIGGTAALAGIGGAVNFGSMFKAYGQTSESRVVIVQGTDTLKMLKTAMRVFRGMDGLVKGKSVVLKPNMSFKNPPAWGNNTSPEVAKAVAMLCLEGGSKSLVAIDHCMGQGGQSITASGVGPALEQLGKVKIISGHQKSEYVPKRVPQGKQVKTVEIHKSVAESDVLINIPVAKQHASTKISFGLKNLMGLIWDRRYFHEMINLHQGVADLATLLRPSLTVIDATRVMLSNGPQGPGKVQTLNTLVVSTDPLAADIVALSLSPWNEQTLTLRDVEHLKAASLLNIGNSDPTRIKIIRKKV